ncbi:MAG: FtsX-like permease family protein [Myxococcota bacterium]
MIESPAYQIVNWVAWGAGALLGGGVFAAFVYLFCGEGRFNPSFAYEGLMARRFLMAKRSHKAVSIITLISILAVMGACAGMVVVMSVMNGFSGDFRDKILGSNPHVMLMRYGHEFSDYEMVTQKTKALPGVLSARPFILGEGMLSSKYNMSGVVLKGILEPDADLQKSIKEGKWDFEGGQGIVIGLEMAKNLKVFLGDAVSLVSPLGELGPTGLLPKTKTFRVSALFNTGMYEYDSKFAYVSLKSAQSLFGLGDAVTGVEYKIANPELANVVSDAIDRILGGYPFYARDWMEMNRPLFSALKLEKIAMFIILMTLMAMASLLILVTLIMVVLEKGKEIAILKSMGATDVSIMKIFVAYGLTIGSIGTALGLAIGLGLCAILQYFGIGLDAEVYYISQIPVRVDGFEVLYVTLGALVVSFLATVPPAWFAARLKPVDGLRS